MSSDYFAIPAELKARKQWADWCYEMRDGKTTKVPYFDRPHHVRLRASSTKPYTWMAYADALASLMDGTGKPYRYDGLEFVLSDQDEYAVVDLDDCRNAETGAITPLAWEYVRLLDSYTEISPSGTGLHIWVKGTLPPGRRVNRNLHVEMYDRGRLITVTGAHLAETPVTIEERQAQIEVLHAEVFGSMAKVSATAKPPLTTGTLGDEEVLQLATTARNGAKVAALYAGSTAGYPSASEADYALIGAFAFYTQEPDQIERLMRRSGLCRPEKWDMRNGQYASTLRRNIETLLERDRAGGRETYTPGRNGRHPDPEPSRESAKPDVGQQGGAEGATQEQWRPSAQSARDLLAKDLAPVRWVVQELIAEGLTLLAAKPKKGKSTLMLFIGCSIAQGTLALGHFETEQSEVLYLALEDNERRMQRRLRRMQRRLRRMQRRLRRMLAGEDPPDGLWLIYSWLPLDRGGMSPLEAWLDEHSAVRVVVIDTLEHIRPRRKVANGLYGDDYASVRWLQHVAGQRQIAVVAITHLRKAPADDPFDEINASNGLLSGVDNAIVMRSAQGLIDVHRRGREYEDDTPIALKGDQERLLWSWQGTAEDAHRSESRKKILECLREHGPLSPLEITEFAEGLTRENVRQLLSRMLKEKTPPIVKDGDDYKLA